MEWIEDWKIVEGCGVVKNKEMIKDIMLIEDR